MKEELIYLEPLDIFIKNVQKIRVNKELKYDFIVRYQKFINAKFQTKFIWEVDNKGHELYKVNGKFGYYEFDNSSKGVFVQVTDRIYKKAKNMKLVTGNIQLTHEGKMYIDSTKFWTRITISNVTPWTPKTLIDVTKYANKKGEKFELTERSLKYLFNEIYAS